MSGRICPDEQAALFWLSYTKVMLMIAPLLLVLMVNMFSHFSDPMDSLRLALIAALGGLLIGLHSIGRRLGQFVATPQKPGAQHDIWLTGASGFIGRNIAAALTAAGHQVRPLSRLHGIDVCRMHAIADWLPFLQGVDAVINSVGIIGESGCPAL